MSTSHHIPAGRLTRSIEIQRGTTTRDEAGAPVTVWTKLAAVKAELVEQAAKDERLADNTQIGREALLFQMRWLNGVMLGDRLLYAGNEYRIVKLEEIGLKRELKIACERFLK